MKKSLIHFLWVMMVLFAGTAYGASTVWLQTPSMDPTDGYAFSSETQVASQVFDDFVYDSAGPISQITWWGSFWNPTHEGTPYYPYPHSDHWGDPVLNPPGTLAGFNITFYQDVTEGSSFPRYAHPDALAAPASYIDISAVTVQNFGTINRSGSTQTLYQYDLVLDRPLALNSGQIYWLSIQAVDPDGEPVQWGWQESSDDWRANAVQIFPGNILSPELLTGENMAFMLEAVPVPTSILLLASGLLGIIFKRRKF